ncbi:MAG: DUF1385 domain-containing protein [Dethiobacter sp.]|jgi:uncharacterized protein YqhQ|nr:MAG: DUF1385 domain-containing protein [Dethiobacter sp.]
MREEKLHIGGQAVIEGVMMRNKSNIAIAVRRDKGTIFVQKKHFHSVSERYPFLKWPLFRGFIAFVEALILGYQSLTLSAEQVLEGEEEELKGWELPVTLAISLAAGIGLFILLPTVLMKFLKQGLEMPLLLNLGEGLLRLVIFLSYILIISHWKEVGRVFQYHGAEHKAIACFEAGQPLTVDNARNYSTLHRRCGTSFLLVVMVTSILLFSFFGWPGLWQRILIRLLLLPLVAGISYEAIKLASARDNIFTRILSQPGLWLQLLTTKKPRDDQVEVAISALQAVLPEEGAAASESVPG